MDMARAKSKKLYLDDVARIDACKSIPDALRDRVTYRKNNTVPCILCQCGKKVRFVLIGHEVVFCIECSGLVSNSVPRHRLRRKRIGLRTTWNSIQRSLNRSQWHLNHVQTIKAAQGGLDAVSLARMEAMARGAIDSEQLVRRELDHAKASPPDPSPTP